ncbi:MAG TPA: cell division protein ZipA C-terminal FtsZ-binding domain-containing protein [Rhodocyclaceae bacterium]|nr:cell division protein ZipA C-terminal FtsZ-binding domain-containing protein [Rhodocyclaceae bacterium]
MHFWPLSGFQLSLIAFGAAAVALVWLYNKWQEHRQRAQALRMFDGDQADVLLAGDATPGAGAEPAYTPDGRIEPVFAASAAADGEDAAAADAGAMVEIEAPPLELADPAVDCLVHFRASEALQASSFCAEVGGTNGLRWRWIGQDGDGRWRELGADAAGSYRHLTAALQLADRSGPLGEADLARHLAAARQVAARFSATVELPEPAAVLEAADRLDRFCAGVDWRLGINAVSASGAGFDLARLRTLIEAAGLRAGADGDYQAEDDAGQRQFTLGVLGGEAGSQAVSGVTLSLDVPLVADGPAAFDRLLAVARELTAQQDGLLVDDQRTPLAAASLVAIRAKIGEFQQKMAAQDIPAGGRRARRLYS